MAYIGGGAQGPVDWGARNVTAPPLVDRDGGLDLTESSEWSEQ